MTFQTLSKNPVTSGVFDEGESWRPTHIDLADRADLFLMAPATANVIAKLALGICDDALTSIALATRAPFLIAPAMNGKMWLHPATQQNVATLRMRGAELPRPRGRNACVRLRRRRPLVECRGHRRAKPMKSCVPELRRDSASAAWIKKSSENQRNSLTDFCQRTIHTV